jgi:predicted lipoprotein with Yx(FWY)xxD motif
MVSPVKQKTLFAFLSFFLVLLPGCAGSTATPVKSESRNADIVTDPGPGAMLTDSGGMVLYGYTQDASGVSHCTGPCAQTWPPYTLPAGTHPSGPAAVTGSPGIIQRADGAYPLTINNMPLYRYSGDQDPGDINGQGVNGVWFAVDPSGAIIKTLELTTTSLASS